MTKRVDALLLSFLVLLLAAACVAPPPLVTPAPAETIPPAAQPTEPNQPDAPSAAVEYNLGETAIVQERFPEDSRFRNMPVRLNGLISAPSEGDGPFPVVVILHGTHPGCPVDEMGVDRWPCDPDVEQPNYRGFDYLVSALAAQGYVVLAPNINAEHTFGFGEPTAGERLTQVLDLHLQTLGGHGRRQQRVRRRAGRPRRPESAGAAGPFARRGGSGLAG